MDTNEFERRLRALARREGLTFATFATLPQPDRRVLVATIAGKFDAGRSYREGEVNEVLKAWLSTAGAMIETDHVHIRRWLVDTGVLTRTSDCAEYRLGAAANEEPIAPGAAGLDGAAIVPATRREAADNRARRKAEWLARGTRGPEVSGEQGRR